MAGCQSLIADRRRPPGGHQPLPVGDRFRPLIQTKPQQRQIGQRLMNRQIVSGGGFVADKAHGVQAMLRHRRLNRLQRWRKLQRCAERLRSGSDWRSINRLGPAESIRCPAILEWGYGDWVSLSMTHNAGNSRRPCSDFSEWLLAGRDVERISCPFQYRLEAGATLCSQPFKASPMKIETIAIHGGYTGSHH